MTPDVRPAVWPFDEAPARARDLAFEFAMSSGDGQIRQVALDDPDGEPFEA